MNEIAQSSSLRSQPFASIGRGHSDEQSCLSTIASSSVGPLSHLSPPLQPRNSPVFMSYRKLQHESDSDDDLDLALSELLNQALTPQVPTTLPNSLPPTPASPDVSQPSTSTLTHSPGYFSAAVAVVQAFKASSLNPTSLISSQSLIGSRSLSRSSLGSAMRITHQQAQREEIQSFQVPLDLSHLHYTSDFDDNISNKHMNDTNYNHSIHNSDQNALKTNQQNSSKLTHTNIKSKTHPISTTPDSQRFADAESTSLLVSTPLKKAETELCAEMDTILNDMAVRLAENSESSFSQSYNHITANNTLNNSHFNTHFNNTLNNTQMNSTSSNVTLAETTVTLDHSYLLDESGGILPSSNTSKSPIPRMAIRSMARSESAVPDVKEIAFLCAPGRVTTVKLSFANKQSKQLKLKAQSIQIRFESINMFFPSQVKQ
jgi:hypothetical protein